MNCRDPAELSGAEEQCGPPWGALCLRLPAADGLRGDAYNSLVLQGSARKSVARRRGRGDGNGNSSNPAGLRAGGIAGRMANAGAAGRVARARGSRRCRFGPQRMDAMLTPALPHEQVAWRRGIRATARPVAALGGPRQVDPHYAGLRPHEESRHVPPSMPTGPNSSPSAISAPGTTRCMPSIRRDCASRSSSTTPR